MNAEVKNYLIQNSLLLKKMDYESIYSGISPSSRGELTTFLFEHNRNPLQYMKKIPERMFSGVTLESLEIPGRITSGDIEGLAAEKVIVRSPMSGNLGIRFLSCNIGKMIIEDGPSRLPGNFIYNTRINQLKLPASIIKLDSNCIDFSSVSNDFIVATPRREGASKLIIPQRDVDNFKKYLRWLRPKEEVI